MLVILSLKKSIIASLGEKLWRSKKNRFKKPSGRHILDHNVIIRRAHSELILRIFTGVFFSDLSRIFLSGGFGR